MSILVIIIIFNALVLGFAFTTKRFLYTRTPEQQLQPIITEFNKNKRAIDDLDRSDYRLGTGHLYQ